MKTIVIIPAYNEEKNIGSVLKKLKRHMNKKIIDKIVVINDGSTDGTGKIAKLAAGGGRASAGTGIEVVRHVFNAGIGSALRTGYKIAFDEGYGGRGGYDYILQMDADGQHDPKYVPQLINAIKESGADIVIGSRFLNESHKNYSLVRRAGISFFTALVKLLSSANISDVTSGYRIYRTDSLKKLGPLPDGHWAIGQTLEAVRRGFKIKEVSIEMPTREKGKSQFDLKTFFYYPFRGVEAVLKVLLFK